MKFRLVEENQSARQRKQLPTLSHADLLTVEEAKKLPQRLRKYRYWWWLQSPGYDIRYAAYVNVAGYVRHNGNDVNDSCDVVRPALRITNLNDYKIGSLFKFGGKWFQIIDENTALCVSDIGKHRFDAYTNDYETSHIKQYVDNWFSENIQKIKQ